VVVGLPELLHLWKGHTQGSVLLTVRAATTRSTAPTRRLSTLFVVLAQPTRSPAAPYRAVPGGRTRRCNAAEWPGLHSP
jgi:hypothetical protein